MGKKRSSRHYLTLDPNLKEAVRSYLQEKQAQPSWNGYADVDDITDNLQLLYAQYKRTQKHALKLSVSKALDQLKLEAEWSEAEDMEDGGSSEVDSKTKSGKSLTVSVEMEAPTNGGETPKNGKPVAENGSDVANDSTPSTPSKRKSSSLDENSSEKKAKKKKRINYNTIDSKVGENSSFLTPTPVPTFGYEVVGGLDEIIEQLRQAIEWPIMFPQIYSELGISPTKGVLLHGPPGCGKTLLANAIAGELGRKNAKFTFFRISAPELVSGMSGESESNIRSLFNVAKNLEPSLIFIDEIDVICPRRDSASKEMERRIVAQLVSSFNELKNTNSEESPKRVIVVGATNRIDSLDPSLRVGGRFDKEIGIKVPDDQARHRILAIHTKKMKLSASFDFEEISRTTPGFVGADLVSLANEAASVAVKRILSDLQIQTTKPISELKDSEGTETQQNSIQTFDTELLKNVCITMEDFQKAVRLVQPSAKREGFATIPNVSWKDIGALEEIRKELSMHILQPIKQPWRLKQVGLDIPVGILLYGPPGCGKTLLAKAIANDCSSSFISVKGPELLNKYVGESERAVRKVFERAKHSLPCVIFFDELDALCPRRDNDDNAVTKRVVNQLLTEIDGLEDRKGIFIIAATNRPDIIDPAMLRHERLGKLLYVPLPDEVSRLKILETLTRKINVSLDVDLPKIAGACKRFSGADLAALTREAAVIAISKCEFAENNAQEQVFITNADFQEALKKTSPSVSEEDEKTYLELKKKFQKNTFE